MSVWVEEEGAHRECNTLDIAKYNNQPKYRKPASPKLHTAGLRLRN